MSILPRPPRSLRLDDLYAQRAAIAVEILREEGQISRADSTSTIASTARLYGVRPEEVASGSREAQVVKARQATCWLLREQGLSFPRIGAALGVHHTTVMHACAKIDGAPAVRAMLWPLLEAA